MWDATGRQGLKNRSTLDSSLAGWCFFNCDERTPKDELYTGHSASASKPNWGRSTGIYRHLPVSERRSAHTASVNSWMSGRWVGLTRRARLGCIGPRILNDPRVSQQDVSVGWHFIHFCFADPNRSRKAHWPFEKVFDEAKYISCAYYTISHMF